MNRFKTRFHWILGILGVTALGFSALPAHALSDERSADPNVTSWVAHIATPSVDGAWNMCSGALIAAQWVVSAAHCFDGAAGTSYVNLGSSQGADYPYQGNRVITHPSLDVAILQLSTPVRGVTPIPLNSAPVQTGQHGIVYGWGVTKHPTRLTEGELSMVGYQGGYLYGRSVWGGVSVVGDSGGPVLVDGSLRGILSAAVMIPEGITAREDFKYAPVTGFDSWVLSSIGVGSQAPTSPQPSAPTVTQPPAGDRVWGANRVLTSLAAMQRGQYTAKSVVIATGRLAPDALSGTALAGALDAPLLLTVDTHIEGEIVQAIRGAGIHDIHLIGGGISFNPQDENNLRSTGAQIARHAGEDRYLTAVAVAQATQAALAARGKPLGAVYFADGLSFADALGAGAGAGAWNGVILLTGAAQIDGATLAQARAMSTAETTIFIVGGPAVRASQAAQVSTQLNSKRIVEVVGQDRYETAALLARWGANRGASAIIASGADFPDGLSGGALAARLRQPLLLTDPHILPGATKAFMNSLMSPRSTVLMGGSSAISNDILSQFG
ncbi:MAG: cell wall-binding repeat-containing protein [Actinomycetaceae bacterium]|nr:cell wall-binding repeat-containing protein [Actinomycetaceae bacterium]